MIRIAAVIGNADTVLETGAQSFVHGGAGRVLTESLSRKRNFGFVLPKLEPALEYIHILA